MDHSIEPDPRTAFTDLIESERTTLVAICLRLSGRRSIAEDLAQESALEAWRHLGQLRDPALMRPWLHGIARNVCRRFLAAQSQSGSRYAAWYGAEPIDGIIDETDFTTQLEAAELAGLLARALDHLPPGARAVLRLRLVDQRTCGEIGMHLGLSENPVSARLHRGKQALRATVELPELRDEATAYGLTSTTPDRWQETNIWCPGCGEHKLLGQFSPTEGNLALRCPQCHAPGVHAASVTSADTFVGIKGFKPALNRLIAWWYATYERARSDGFAPVNAIPSKLLQPLAQLGDERFIDHHAGHGRRCLGPMFSFRMFSGVCHAWAIFHAVVNLLLSSRALHPLTQRRNAIVRCGISSQRNIAWEGAGNDGAGLRR